MTREEFLTLCRDDVRLAIECNIDREPTAIALDARVVERRVVASQVKNLQRCRLKHPTLYAARCILPDRSVEQSSSEACAAAKPLRGESLLDMTCGLGGDTIELSRRFSHVVALERDEVLADVVRENLRRLGITNVDVVTASAEEYLERCDEHFSAIIVDPDRRISERRSVRLEDSSPNVVALMPRMRQVAEQIAIKCSPLFDVDEARRLFADCSVEVVSLRGECKEVNIYIGLSEPHLSAVAVGRARYDARCDSIGELPLPESFRASDYRYLITPDVALQKARLVRHSLCGVADCWSENSFGFATQSVEGRIDVVGRVEPIRSIEPLDWKSLKRRYGGRGVDIVLRDCPLDVKLIHKRLSTHSGSDYRLAFTRICGTIYCICLG